MSRETALRLSKRDFLKLSGAAAVVLAAPFAEGDPERVCITGSLSPLFRYYVGGLESADSSSGGVGLNLTGSKKEVKIFGDGDPAYSESYERRLWTCTLSSDGTSDTRLLSPEKKRFYTGLRGVRVGDDFVYASTGHDLPRLDLNSFQNGYPEVRPYVWVEREGRVREFPFERNPGSLFAETSDVKVLGDGRVAIVVTDRKKSTVTPPDKMEINARFGRVRGDGTFSFDGEAVNLVSNERDATFGRLVRMPHGYGLIYQNPTQVVLAVLDEKLQGKKEVVLSEESCSKAMICTVATSEDGKLLVPYMFMQEGFPSTGVDVAVIDTSGERSVVRVRKASSEDSSMYPVAQFLRDGRWVVGWLNNSTSSGKDSIMAQVYNGSNEVVMPYFTIVPEGRYFGIPFLGVGGRSRNVQVYFSEKNNAFMQPTRIS